MAKNNKIVESILAKEKAKGATKPEDIKPTQGMSIAEKIDAKMQETQRQLSDMAARIGANAEAMQGALAYRDYEITKANTAKMLDESTLGTKPYASSEDGMREVLQGFMDKKVEESRERGMKDYLDNTIGVWSADRVSSIVGGLTDADSATGHVKRIAESVLGLKEQADAPVSFSGLADRSMKEASKVVKDYLAENPHMEANAELLESYVANNIYNDTFKWKLENDEQFFADALEATTGKSYAEYKREVDNEARVLLESMKRELEAMNEVLKKKRDENRTNAGQSRSLFSAAWSDLKNTFGGNIEEIENLIDEIDNVLEGSFSSGFDKGFDFDRMATMGLSGVFTEGEMANALKKANNGQSLTEEEENYVRIHQYAQELNQLQKVREKYAEQMYDKFLGFNLNSIGEGVGTTVEMMPAFAGSMNATGMIGKFADIGTRTAFKSAFKAGGKELFKYGVKTTSKLGYNYGLAKARGLVAAPFMPMTYNTYLESLNSAYSFDDNGNLTYKPVDNTQAYFGAVFSTANEISSEYLGVGIGKVVGWGARGVGRMATNTKIAGPLVDASNKARKYLPKLTPEAKVAMRTFGVQADPISETLSEALGDIMTSYEQSMIGMDVDMSKYGTFDYWMTLAGVTLVHGGSMAAMGGVKSYADVRSAVKERDAILGKISNRNLYNTLLAVSTSDDVVLASSALADFDWEGNDIKPEDEDRRLAEAYVAADLNVKIMEGAVEEGSRLGKFRGTIEGVRNIVYQGKAGEYSDKIFEAEVDGKKVFVVNGFENDSTTNLYVVVDAATGEKSSVDKSKVKLTRELDVDTYIQEAYTNAFSLESEKSRVKDVREKALQMDNPTEKDVQRVASTLNITLPKVGDAVMLANGNMGSVTERLSPTEYAVQDLSGATYKVHFTDILSTDKLTATVQGALARGEVSTPMTSVPQENAATEATVDENGIAMGSEVTVDGRVGKVRARTENGDYVVSFEDENGNYENAEVEVYTPTEMASLMGVAPMPSATTESTTEGTPTTTEVATTEDGSVDIEQMSAEDAAKVLVERAGTIEEAIAQVKQVIETVTEERKKMAKAEKKASLNDIGKKSAELQALDARLEFYGEVLGVLEGMLADQQKQTMTEAQSIAEGAGVATTETPNDGDEKSAETPTSGLIRNGAEMKFTDNVIRMVDFIAQRLGVTVEFVDDLKNEAGQHINGDIKGKHVRISTKGDRGVKFIVGHEFFHRIKDNIDEATYNKYIDALKEFFGEESWEAALIAQKRKYRAHNVAVAKKSMEEMTPEEVAAIAEQLGVNIEDLSAEDAKAAVARAAMRKAEQGDEVARALFPTMLTYSDELMLEETAADISGEMVANLDAFSNFVEDNKSEYAIIRGIHKALRYINDMFASFGETTRQRKVKRLVKNLESIMAEAVKNEREGVKKAREEAKKKANTPTDDTVVTNDKGDVEAVTNEQTGQANFSLSTYREGGREALSDFLDARVVENALTPKEAADMMQQMDDIYEACTTMADKYEPFGQWSEAKVVEDKDGNPVFSVIKANGDYAMNLDFSLVCKKRRTLDAVLNNMVKRGMIKSVSQKDTTVAKINEVIRKYGFETACALCFVDARRFQVIKTARQFCDLYNDMVDLLIPKKSNIAVNEFNFANREDVVVAENSLDMMSDDALNIEAVRKIGYKVEGKKKDGSDKYGMSVMAKIARHLVEHPEDRKHLSPSDFISTAGFDRVKEQKPAILSLYNAKKGTGGPKAAFSDVQYLNDIIRSNWKVDEAYAVGGVRLQSFSDYVPRMVFDYIQMVAELAAKKLPVHAYTKEALFAMTFGLTGMKINLSLVPDVVEGGVAAGLDAEGNYVWKQGETFPYEEAIALQNAEGYRENCGTIAVGVSDAHILKMLDDDNIRMVIPYHKSGLPKQVAKMNNVAAFTDYTNVQNTTKDGKAITKEEAKDVPNYNELLREHKDARKAAQAYVDWCTERGYTPKFAKFANHPNYYKLLEDFTTMVDGKYAQQEAVTFTFPTEESAFGGLESLIEQGLEEDAVLEGQRDVKVDAIVEEVGEVLGVQPKFSLPSLVGVHNISLDKLRKAIKMGGLANPSVAVIDVDKQIHDGYGEYSLVLSKNMVDAQQGDNAGTWADDAVTPVYPNIVRRIDDEALSRFYKDVEALPKAMQNSVRFEFEEFLNGRKLDGLGAWYLFEKNGDSAIKYVPSRYSDEVSNAVKEATNGSFSLAALTPEERAKCLDIYIAEEYNGDTEAFEAVLEQQKKELEQDAISMSEGIKEWRHEKLAELNEYGFDYDAVAGFLRDVGKDMRESGAVDVRKTIESAKKEIKANNLEADYEAWLNSLDERYGIKEYISDGYTENGGPKYLPHTLENVSKWMREQGRQGASVISPTFKLFSIAAIPHMTTLESIRKHKALLGKSKKEHDAFVDKWGEVYEELATKLHTEGNVGNWGLIEAVGHNNPKEFIKKEYGIELSEEDMAKFNDMVNAMRTEYPAGYFETKFERPLQLSDFTAAVVPNDIPSDVESRLKDAGVEVIEYEKGDNTSRAEAMQKASQMENVRFSIIGEVGASALDMAEEATIRMDNLAVAREMETSGKDAKAIRMATGWERGADGLWRFELMDYVTPKTFTNLTGKGKEKILAERNTERKVLEQRINNLETIMRMEYAPDMFIKLSWPEEVAEKIQAIADEYKGDKKRMEADYQEAMKRLFRMYAYGDTTFMLEEVIGKDHEIFKAYPELKDVSVEIEKNNGQDYGGNYNHKTKRIRIVDYKDRGKYEAGAIVHEIQHAIQYIEGFTLGTNPKTELPVTEEQKKSLEVIREMTSFVDLYKDNLADAIEESVEYGNPIWDNLSQHAKTMLKYFGRRMRDGKTIDFVNESLKNMHESASVNLVGEDRYHRQAGEVEARNVSARLNMTPEERRATLLSETEDVAREDQIFLREGAEMAMAKNVGLPKEEYAKLASTIMTRQHTYGRPPFDYAFTDGSFYVYDYLGDGDSIINFAMPIVGNEDLIQNITNSIDNGTITDTRGLDLYAENLQGKQRVNYRRFADAFKKRHGNRGYGVTFRGDSASNGGTYFEDSKRIGGDATTRGTSGNIDESANQELTTRFSLVTPEMDASYLDAVNRGDMATAQNMVMEAAKLAMPNTKVVDGNGNPKVVYHGADNDFTVFDRTYFGKTDGGSIGKGFYFAVDKSYAEKYYGASKSCFVNLTNPVDARVNPMQAFFLGSNNVEEALERVAMWKDVPREEKAAMEAEVKKQGTPEVFKENEQHDGAWYMSGSKADEVMVLNPNQIKSADPVTYDDAGNVIPLSERFNPRKEDIRYSISNPYGGNSGYVGYSMSKRAAAAREEGRYPKTDFKKMYNMPQATLDALVKAGVIYDGEWHHTSVYGNRTTFYGWGEDGEYPELAELYKEHKKSIDKVVKDGADLTSYIEMFSKREDEITEQRHLEYLAALERKKQSEITRQRREEYIRKHIPSVINASNGVEVQTNNSPYLSDWIATKDGERLSKRNRKDERDEAFAEVKKRVAEIGEEYDNRHDKMQPIVSRIVAADANPRNMLPDPDPSDVFYDEIPIFDEQGNEIDLDSLNPEEAKAILDSKVRQMLEAEYEHNISAIRKEARETRQAIIDRYNEEKNKRKKNNKPSRTNAARIDDILGDKPFESLPLEDQALILIATGQAKIRWSDNGAQRGLASELGLKGSKGDKHAYRSIWSGATKSFNEVVHDWWESIGGQERGIDDQDLRNALIDALQSVQNAKDAMGEIMRKYDDLSAERDAALAEVDRMEEKDLREAKAAYEQHSANFELSEGEERASFHDRAAQFFGDQNLSRTDEILADLTNELERQKRKIERLKAENKDIYTPLAEGIQKSKDIILHALERLRMFAGMEEVDLNDVARLINLVKTARSQRQVENLGAQATALVQRISIKKAKANLYRLLSLKLSNTDIIHKMLAESDKWTKEERDAILKHLWKVSRNGLRVSKAVHRDTKEIFDELKRLVEEFRKEKLKGLDNEQKALVIDAKLAELEKELHPEVVYDSKGNVQDNSNLPTDFNAENKHLAKYLFKSHLEMLAAEAKYRNASKVLSEKTENKEQTGDAYADVVATREDYLHALTQLNKTLEHLILKGKDELRDWNAQKEKHEIEIRRMGIEAIGGEKADSQGKRSKWGARQRARWNTSVNAPYWTFETVLEKIDHKTPYKRGKFYTYFMDKWSDANDDLITRYMAHFEELGEAMSKCFPNDATFMKMKRNPYRMFQYIMRKAESTPIGNITYKEGDGERQMVLNVANAMYIIAMWRQPRYQEAMKERGITQQDVDTLMQSIASKDAGFIDFMDWVNEKFLPSTRLEYDVVFRKMNGGSMPKEVNYFPARVAAHQEVDLANIENGAMPTTPTALKDRTSHNIMPEMGMDYFKVLEAHIEDMDKWAAYAELTADLNVLLSSDEFRRRLNEYMGGLGGDGGGKGSLYELFKQTSLIATGLYRGDAGMQAFLGNLQKAWATSNIAFRGWTALKQISSVTTGMFDNLRFYKHALKAASIVGIYSEIKDAMAVSPSLRQRWKSGAAGMEALAREAQRADGYTVHRGAYEKSRDAIGDAIKLLVRAGMTPNAAVDLLSCSIIVNSVYETEIARLTGGKREATAEEKRAAVRKAERAFNTTQQSSEGAYLAPVQANPAFGVLTTYMNASFALHRKRMAGVKDLWKLMTSKEYRRFIKDEYGADAAKMSAVDAMKDVMSGIAGELSFVAMGWGLMEFMSWVNSWFNDDDDDDDTAAAKAEFADIWWQSFLNGYLGGSLATSIMQGFDTSLTPAYDEFISDVKGIFDDKGDAMSEVAQVTFKYGLGIDLKALYKAGVGFRNLFEDDERVGAILMLLNAPERYVKAFVGDRREGETMEEYQTRIVRFYTLFDDVKYSDYFDENGKYIGEDAPSIIMSKTMAQALRKEYEAAYRKDVLHHYGGKEAYASYMETEKKYKDICELLGWKAETNPSKEKSKLSDIHKELANEQKQVAKKAEKRKNWVGSEEEYYDKLVDEQKAKDELINQYYEYIKQSGLGAY